MRRASYTFALDAPGLPAGKFEASVAAAVMMASASPEMLICRDYGFSPAPPKMRISAGREVAGQTRRCRR